jgi:hypothetical protein
VRVGTDEIVHRVGHIERTTDGRTPVGNVPSSPAHNDGQTDGQLQVLTGARPTAGAPFTATTMPDCHSGVTSSEFDAKFTGSTN